MVRYNNVSSIWRRRSTSVFNKKLLDSLLNVRDFERTIIQNCKGRYIFLFRMYHKNVIEMINVKN